MKKMLLSIFAATLLLSGCGSSNTTAPVSQPSQNEVVETSPPPEPKKWEWNTDSLDPIKNGNMEYAIKLVREHSGDLADSAVSVDVADVMKRPWDYYGQVISFSGVAAVLQDYPPGDNTSKALGGESCEIVMNNGDIIIDGILLGNTKGIYTGDWVTFYGYPCGIMEVENKIGGKFSHLIVIGTR